MIECENWLPESHVPRAVSPVLLGKPDVTIDELVDYEEGDSGVVAKLQVPNGGPVPAAMTVRAVWADATPEDGTFAEEDLLGTTQFDLPTAVGDAGQTVQIEVPLADVDAGDELRFVFESVRPVEGAGIPVVYDEIVTIGPTVADYANEEGVVETDGLLAAVDDWAVGDIETSLLIDVVNAWASAEPVS